MDACNRTDDSLTLVGPVEVFASLGHWSTVVYIILFLHFVPVWVAASTALLHLRRSSPPSLFPSLVCLTCLPPALMSLATIGILLPSTGTFIEMLIEIVLTVGMVSFNSFVLSVFGDSLNLAEVCFKDKIVVPLGAPPCCFLQPCNKPIITTRNLNFLTIGTKLLVAVKIAVLVIEILLSAVGYPRDPGNFIAVDNIHQIIQFPICLVGMYFYTMFIIIAYQVLKKDNKKFLGFIILLQFVFFDCFRLFYVFLAGSGMLTCVPPYLTVPLVVDVLKNCMKGFLATFIGLPFIKLCTSPGPVHSHTQETSVTDVKRSDSVENGSTGSNSSGSASPESSILTTSRT